jgi:hypothetical protein
VTTGSLPRSAGEFFETSPGGLAIYQAVAEAVARLGPAEVRISKSQIAFKRRRGFAYVWKPGQYMKSEVPAVLSLALPRELGSPRIKETVHPSPKVWMHHLVLQDPAGVDTEVTRWLSEAYEAAG